MNAPTQPNETSPEKQPALPDAWIRRLFSRLSAMYGSRFADMWRGCDLDDVKAVWAADLGVLSRAELVAGVEACKGRDWPPTLPEFLKLCRPPVDFGAALSEAIAQTIKRKTGEDAWSSKAVFWAAQKVSSWELENRSRRDLEPLWKTELSKTLADPNLPDIPPRSKTLPAPGQATTATSADVEKIIRSSGIGSNPCGDRAWSFRLKDRHEAGEELSLVQERMYQQALAEVALP